MTAHDRTVHPFVCPSFFDTLNQVMLQVEYHCFADLRTGYIAPFFKELCFIASEILIMNPDSVVKVNGSSVPISVVQQIFSLLRNEHLRLVFDNYQNVLNKVYNKKAYLRTALYNAVFEIESTSLNERFN